jgi:HAD superfamily hydrolase (TIGR01509 family)
MAIRAVLFDLDFTLWHLGSPFFAVSGPADLLADKDLQRLIRFHQLSRIAAVIGDRNVSGARQPEKSAESVVTQLEGLWRAFMVSSELKEIDGPALLRKSLAASGLVAEAERANEIWEVSYVPYPDFPLQLYGDTLATLDRLRSLRLKAAIVTNSPWPARVRRPDIDALGIGTFVHAFFASADAGYRKPHPLIFERALAALGVEPAEAVMVGDEIATDVAGARNAGMAGIWKRNGKGDARPMEADFVIDDLGELIQLDIF